MIITEQKPLEEILEMLKDYSKIFLVGCGECATTCKTGGQEELLKMKAVLEQNGKTITGSCIPDAPCIASQVKAELARNAKTLRGSEAILVLACGLGAQSVKENNRFSLGAFSACNTICGALVDSAGNFFEKCSMCGNCILGITAGICPETLCPKGLLNGPCGGMNKGKCEVDPDKDCAWVLIYKELEKTGHLDRLREVRPAKDHKKTTKPHKIIMTSDKIQIPN
ncbi:MAG: methylenetetrahydrofolate reductase C-terminal domain-containing protein [Candidatus Omnitrophica bacterium]|nr:methylenetetrahydrofolate reductase C-terminal domain-containing protein [Candidatus Omnitrophota bacterium]